MTEKHCQDCEGLDRRSFVKTVGGAALAGAAAPLLFNSRFAHAAPSATSDAETAVGEFYASLSEKQRAAICLPFNHEHRSNISANWHVTETTIGDFTKAQQELTKKIVQNVTSPDGYERLLRQMEDDDGGIESYSVAVFGEPGTSKFQWELTGRHLTLRADGNTVDKAAFGGPVVYGHGEEDAKQNLFHYQTQKANEVFKALDAKQAELALLKAAPDEAAVQLQGKGASFPGIAVKDLSPDQRQLVRSTIRTIMAPYRKEDVDEVIETVKNNGGLSELHMAFYQEDDLDDDKVWDIWRIEGPSLVCHFRGAPHVHAYINVGVKS
jgi:hypothetical protein